MPAVGYEGTDTDNLDIVHRCVICNKTIRNRTAPDDNLENILNLAQ